MTIDLTSFFTVHTDDCCPHCGAPGSIKIDVVIAGDEIKGAVQPFKPRKTTDPAPTPPEPDGEEDP